MAQVSLLEAARRIRVKEHYHKGMCRLGWFLPSLKSNVITKCFLDGVRDGEVFALKNEQVQIIACVEPPPLVAL